MDTPGPGHTPARIRAIQDAERCWEIALASENQRPDQAADKQKAALLELRKAYAVSYRAVIMDEEKNTATRPARRNELYRSLISMDIAAALKEAHMRGVAFAALPAPLLDPAKITAREAAVTDPHTPRSARMRAAKRLADDFEHAQDYPRSAQYLKMALAVVAQPLDWE
jgi:hypothetical protein